MIEAEFTREKSYFLIFLLVKTQKQKKINYFSHIYKKLVFLSNISKILMKSRYI